MPYSILLTLALLADMEATGLFYNASIQVIIYTEYSYYLARSSIKRYLQAIYIMKGVALKAVYNKVAKLLLADFLILEVPSSDLLIPYLTIKRGF